MFSRFSWATSVVTASVLASACGPALAATPTRTVIVTDQSNNRFFTVATNGTHTTTTTPPRADLNGLFGPAYDAAGNLFIAEGEGRIFKITPTGTQSTFATLPAGAGPGAIVFDQSGNMFTDGVDGNIYKITSTGSFSVFATLPAGSLPYDMTIDSNGNLYTANQASGNSNISKISPAGVVSPFATLSATNLWGLTVDGSNNIYASTYTDGAVTKITQAGAKSLYAQFGDGLVDEIHDIEFAPDGDLYVTAARSEKLLRFSGGVVSTYASGLSGANMLAFAPVPEPATLSLLAVAGVGLLRRRRA